MQRYNGRLYQYYIESLIGVVQRPKNYGKIPSKIKFDKIIWGLFCQEKQPFMPNLLLPQHCSPCFCRAMAVESFDK